MSDGSATKGLRERLAGGTEDRLGRALTDLLENPLLNSALGRAAEAREKATQAQELAMGALNLPSAADIERLTRRLRSVSQRLEGIEDGVHSLGRGFSPQSIDARLGTIEDHLVRLSRTVADLRESLASRQSPERAAAKQASERAAAKRPPERAGARRASEGAAAKRAPAGAKPKRPAKARPAKARSAKARSAAKRPKPTAPEPKTP